MVKIRVVTSVEKEVLYRLDKLRGESTMWNFLERVIVEGVEKIEQARGVEAGTGQGSEIVSGDDRQPRERGFSIKPENQYFKRKKGK